MKVFIILISLLVLLTSDVWAGSNLTDETYFDKVSYKLGRGLNNVALSGSEVIRSLEDAQALYGHAGMFIGFIHGSGKMLGRALLGLADVVTFPTGATRKEGYQMEPQLASFYGTAWHRANDHWLD